MLLEQNEVLRTTTLFLEPRPAVLKHDGRGRKCSKNVEWKHEKSLEHFWVGLQAGRDASSPLDLSGPAGSVGGANRKSRTGATVGDVGVAASAPGAVDG